MKHIKTSIGKRQEEVKLISLLTEIADIFRDFENQNPGEIKRKNNIHRDIVTEVDQKIHRLVYDFSKINDIDVFVSEEGKLDKNLILSKEKKYLILDPLDGTLSYVKKLNYFCTMIAILEGGLITYSALCIPSKKQIVTYDTMLNKFESSRKVELDSNYSEGATYFAYPSKQDFNDQVLKKEIIDLIDVDSSGLFRLGSAGYGFYLTLQGKLCSFIGQKVKIWDAIAFLPLAERVNLHTAYFLIGYDLYLIASWNLEFFKKALNLFLKNNIEMKIYKNNKDLTVFYK